MPDDADRSDKAIFDRITHGVELAQIEAAKPRIFYAECNWCGDSTEAGARYCCGECRDDHMRFNIAKERHGER